MSEPAPEPRRSYRQGDALRDALAALGVRAARPTVTVSRDASGGYSYDVRVIHDDAGEAARVAITLEEMLAKQYPPLEHAPVGHKASLTRNAKGETQIDIEGRYVDDAELTQLAERYEALRGRYPLNDGTATHDQPKRGAK